MLLPTFLVTFISLSFDRGIYMYTYIHIYVHIHMYKFTHAPSRKNQKIRGLPWPILYFFLFCMEQPEFPGHLIRLPLEGENLREVMKQFKFNFSANTHRYFHCDFFFYLTLVALKTHFLACLRMGGLSNTASKGKVLFKRTFMPTGYVYAYICMQIYASILSNKHLK